MSIFLETNHLFLRNPRGGVEDVANMRTHGFGAIFCNIKDYPVSDWQLIRDRAASFGVVCGPWLRTTYASGFEPALLELLISTAEAWGTPFIVNSESELKDSGNDLTDYIAEQCAGREWALSMEPWPFANVDWTPIEVPVLPQIFGPQWGADAAEARAEWQRCGVSCVVHTFGTYSGWTPELYDLLSPYGLYTADDCGNDFARWGSRGTTMPCVSIPAEEAMQQIGSQHGITGMADVFRQQWPDKTGKPDPDDPSTWKAIDKWERTMLILAQDHDKEATT
jgi:hypothetical protein